MRRSTRVSKLSLRQKLRQSVSSQSAPNPPIPVTAQQVVSSPLPTLHTNVNVPSSQQICLPVSSPPVDQAVQQLAWEDRIILQSYLNPTPSGTDTAIQQALKAAKEKRKDCIDKRWTCIVAGKHIVLREKADAIVRWLNRFKTIGDVASNADPVHVGLPWASIRLLLEVATADSNQMAALLVGCEAVLYTSSRLGVYVEFMQNLPTTLAKSNLERSIVLSYKHVLHFLAQAIRVYETSTPRRMLTAFWKINDIVDFEKKGDEMAAQVERDASNCDRTGNVQTQHSLDLLQQKLRQVLTDLQQCRQIQQSLDQLSLKIDLNKIPYVRGALFNSVDGIHTVCHPATRVDLLAQVQYWIQAPDSKPIFWLHGAAGIGKSTISWTIAQWLVDRNGHGDVDLGASFFFKRGEGDRGSAARFFPTLVRQLILKIPGFDIIVGKAIDSDPFIFDRAIAEQFRRLILHPLQDSSLQTLACSTLVVVVDALDECGSNIDIQTILDLWTELSKVKTVRLRLFLTSRPDQPVRLKFRQIPTNLFDSIVLHDAVPQSIIQQDLLVYLEDKFKMIRDQHNIDSPSGFLLNEQWPKKEDLISIADIAVPLFIVAATICRFVGDLEFDPLQRLEEILALRQTGHLGPIELTYRSVLHYLTTKRDNKEQTKLREEFRAVIGSIICLAEPLSVSDLAVLLRMSIALIARRLSPLHAVLRIPNDCHTPVRTLHLSFAEFLLSEEMQNEPFGIHGSEAHGVLMNHCLVLLSENLQENMCDLEYPGQFRQEIYGDIIANKFSPALQYACRYWIYHARLSNVPLQDEGEVHIFLKEHYLHWLEALSVLGRISEAVELIYTLQSSATFGSQFFLFLEDARRFILANRYVADQAPLQLYSSAVLFAPQTSLVRKICGRIPGWIVRSPDASLAWDAELQVLEGNTSWESTLAWSPDSLLIASGSTRCTIRLWNSRTGQELHTLRGHTGAIRKLAFSPTDPLLASTSDDKTLRIWNIATGCQIATWSCDIEKKIEFAPNGLFLALLSTKIRFLDILSGKDLHVPNVETALFNDLAFFPCSSRLATACSDYRVWIWSCNSEQDIFKLTGHTDSVKAVTISPDGSIIASGSDDDTIRLWRPSTGEMLQVLYYCPFVRKLSFSCNGLILASLSDIISTWEVNSMKLREERSVVGNFVDMASSPSGPVLVSISIDRLLQIWDSRLEAESDQGTLPGFANSVFSRDGTLLASTAYDAIIRIWDCTTGRQLKQFSTVGMSEILAFSPDGRLLASGGLVLSVWNLRTQEVVLETKRAQRCPSDIVFSSDGSLLAVVGDVINVWSLENRNLLSTFEIVDRPISVVFSSKNSRLALVSLEGVFSVWDVTTGQELYQLHDLNDFCHGRSPDESKQIWVDPTGMEFTDADQHVYLFRKPYALFIHDGWIWRNDRRLLWLPRRYRRPSASHNEQLVIGLDSSHLDFYRFDFSSDIKHI